MRATAVRILAVLSVVVLTAVMVRSTLRPDWPETTVQIGFLIAVIGSGWLGALGAIGGRSSPIAVGVAGLFVLGVWQAALWIVMLPAAGLLLAAWFVVYSDDVDDSTRGNAAGE